MVRKAIKAKGEVDSKKKDLMRMQRYKHLHCQCIVQNCTACAQEKQIAPDLVCQCTSAAYPEAIGQAQSCVCTTEQFLQSKTEWGIGFWLPVSLPASYEAAKTQAFATISMTTCVFARILLAKRNHFPVHIQDTARKPW